MTVCSHPHIREWPGTPEAGRGGGERTHATEEHNRGVINRRDEESETKFCILKFKHIIALSSSSC